MGFPKLLRDVKEKLSKYEFHIGTINGVPQENGNYFFIADKDYIIGGGDGFCHYEVIKGNYKRVPHNEVTVDGIKCCKTNHGMGYFFLELHFEFENNDYDLYKVYRSRFLPLISSLCTESYELFRWLNFHEKPVISIRLKNITDLEMEIMPMKFFPT